MTRNLKIHKRLKIPFAVGLILLVGFACRRGDVAREPLERVDATTLKVQHDALANLKLATVSMTDFPDQLYVMGKISITEDRTNVVPARVSGRIDRIFFASGETVTQGKPLATLFSPDFVAAKEEYLQAIKQSSVAPGGSKADPSDFANLARMARKKLEVMGLSSRDVESLKESVADSGAGAPAGTASDRSDAAGKSAAEMPQLLIRAPRSGVIIAKSAILGNLVNVGDTLFIIGDLGKVWFLGDLYPEDLPKVHKDQEVRIVATGVDKPLTGKVSFISPIVDPTSRTIKIRALINNASGGLRGDEYVQGSLILDDRRAILAPTGAIIRTSEGDSIFKRVNPKTVESSEGSVLFQRVPVKLGAERQGMTAILEGLKDGDQVVSDGGLLLDAALNTSETGK